MGKRLMNGIMLITVVLGLSLFILKGYHALQSDNSVLFTFSVTSDSQVDLDDPQIFEQEKKWGVRSSVLNRMLGEIQEQKPQMLFFNGDAIDGNTKGDASKLDSQYAYWRGNIARLIESGIYVFPIPGNHEMQDTDEKTRKHVVTSLNEDSWRKNMGDLIPDKKLWEELMSEPFSTSSWSDINYAQADDDGILSDQRKLSYSFDFKDSHFIVVNSFAMGNEYQMPLMRLKEDIFDAKRRGVKHIFIFGHLPAFSYKFDASSVARGLDVNVEARDAFWKLVEESKATYFCGHEHVFYASQPNGSKAYQIISGPAGGPFKSEEPVRNPDLLKYSWVNVKVYKDGKVHIDAFGFDDNGGKTSVLKCWDLESGF